MQIFLIFIHLSFPLGTCGEKRDALLNRLLPEIPVKEDDDKCHTDSTDCKGAVCLKHGNVDLRASSSHPERYGQNDHPNYANQKRPTRTVEKGTWVNPQTGNSCCAWQGNREAADNHLNSAPIRIGPASEKPT